MKRTTSTSGLALALAVSLVAASLPIAAETPTQGSLSGIVRAAGSPLPGARVFAADKSTGEILPAVSTDGNGRFSLGAMRPATYELAIETKGNLYVAEKPVPVAAGARRQVEVGIRAETTAAEQTDGATGSGGGGLSRVWDNPLTAAFIVVGAAVVVGVLVDNATDDEDASPTN